MKDKLKEKEKKIELLVELTYDAELMHGDDKEATDWFFNTVMNNKLILHSNEIGDEVGIIKIIKIL